MNKDVKIGLILGLVLLVATFAYVLKTRDGDQGSVETPQNKAEQAQIGGGGVTGTTEPADNDPPPRRDPTEPDPLALARLVGTPGIPPPTKPEKTDPEKEEWEKILERIKSGNTTEPSNGGTGNHGNNGTDTEGGSETTGPTDNESEPAPIPEPKIHTAVKGDTLSEISAKFYGTSRKWELILKANPDLLMRPEDLRPGMELIIPVVTVEPKADAGTGRTDPSLAGKKTYTVRKKDSYWSIAKKTMGSGTKSKKLFEANKDRLKLNSIDDPLKPGMVLVIPRD